MKHVNYYVESLTLRMNFFGVWTFERGMDGQGAPVHRVPDGRGTRICLPGRTAFRPDNTVFSGGDNCLEYRDVCSPT